MNLFNRSYALNKTLTPNQNKLFFTTLNDLALFYPFTNATFSANLTGVLKYLIIYSFKIKLNSIVF